MATVQLRIAEPDRRKRVAEMLPNECEALVEEEASDGSISSADLVVTDLDSLRARETAGPAGNRINQLFSSPPTLLLARRTRFSEVESVVWEQVDEVIGTPLHESELEKRIRALLRLRRRGDEPERIRSKRKTPIESRPHAVLTLSNQEIIDANRQAGRLFSVSCEALTGTPLTALVASGQRGKSPGEVLATLSEEASETEAIQFEWEFRPPEGPSFWAECVLTRVAGEGDERMQMLVRDISDRKKTEQRLRRRQRQLAAAQKIARLGSWERDLEREELYWSEQTYRIFGIDPDDALDYETFMAAVHPEDRVALRIQQERLLEEGTPIDIEYRIVRPDGEQRVLHERGEAEVGPSGEPVRFYGAVLDVTDRKHRERRINRLRKKYETLLEEAPDAIFVAEAESGRIVEANEAAASLLEAPVDEIVGRHQSELHPLGKDKEYRSLFEQHKDDAKTGAEIRRRLPEGSQIYVESNSGDAIPVEISATFLEFEEETFFIGIFRDVTRRPRYQTALKRR